MKTQRMEEPDTEFISAEASAQFLLPETLAFIMKMQNQQQKETTNITNVNNNINFYGPVVSHVYQTGSPGGQIQDNSRREAQSRAEPTVANDIGDADVEYGVEEEELAQDEFEMMDHQRERYEYQATQQA